jgi:hypothetical protein
VFVDNGNHDATQGLGPPRPLKPRWHDPDAESFSNLLDDFGDCGNGNDDGNDNSEFFGDNGSADTSNMNANDDDNTNNGF